MGILGRPPLFRSERSWDFAVGPGELWDLIVETDNYRSWWPWLQNLDVDGGFDSGALWRCRVSPPLPYVVRFHIHFRQVEPLVRVVTEVTGDVEGTAELSLAETDQGSTATLRSELAPANLLLRRVASTARPLVEWGHDWVLDTGQRQFLERAGLD